MLSVSKAHAVKTSYSVASAASGWLYIKQHKDNYTASENNIKQLWLVVWHLSYAGY